MDRKSFNPGDVIFREGDDSQEAYRILTGRVEISIRTPYGLRPVAQLGEGEIFGEMGLIDDKPRSATAKALDPTDVEVISEENFAHAVLGDGEKLANYLAALFERLRTTDMLLELAIRRNPGAQGVGSEASEVSPSMETALFETHPREGTAASQADAGGGGSPRVFLRSRYQPGGWQGDPVDREITKFPFKIGRQHFGPASDAMPFAMNDLAVRDKLPFNISRHHCAIERDGETVFVRDRGSTVGTMVNGTAIGLKSGVITARLERGENALVLGAAEGPHHFVVEVEGAG